jgi:hypothetical protein
LITAAINALKGQLKLDHKLSAIVNEGKKKGNKKDEKKNKKNTFNQREQKKDEAWKKEPPKEGEKHEKEVGKYTYHWCEHHMVWTVHKPTNGLLGKQHKEDQKKKPQKAVANSATFVAAAAMPLSFTRSSCNWQPLTLSPPPKRCATTCSHWERMWQWVAATSTRYTASSTRTTHNSLPGA